MKIKIFALILAVCCLSSLFVACKAKCETHTDADNNGECDVCGAEVIAPCETHTDADNNLICDVCGNEITTPCDPHKDDNADKLCDACGGAIVTIIQEQPPVADTKVDMVVNAIPENVALGEYLNVKPFGKAPLANVEEIKGFVGSYGSDGQYVYTVTEAADGDYNVHKVYDVVTGKVAFTVDNKYVGNDGNGTKTVNVSFQSHYVTVGTVVREIVNARLVTTYTQTLYTYSGDIIFTESNTDSGTSNVSSHSGNDDDVLYISIDGTIYLIDKEDDKLIASYKQEAFVDRPVFDKTTDNYGYYTLNGTTYVYDLSKWIDCVYSYTVPSYYTDVKNFYLDNGNVLIQSKLRLDANAVNFDILEYGYKYDLVYTLINVADKTATDIEFGYYITDIDNDPSEEKFTAKAINVATVYPIVANRIDTNETKYFVVDNTLQILYDVESVLNYSAVAVAENLFIQTIHYSNGETVYEIVNEKGEHVAYVPAAGDRYAEYVRYGNKLYNFKMELIVDLEDYDYYTLESNYAILTDEEGAKYFLNYSASPVKIDLADVYVVDTYVYGYVVSYTNSDNLTEYAFYNVDGNLVYKTVKSMYGFDSVSYENNVYMFHTTDGTFIVK